MNSPDNWGNSHLYNTTVPQGGTLFSIWSKVLPPTYGTDGKAPTYPNGGYWNKKVYLLVGGNWEIQFITGNIGHNPGYYNANSMFFVSPRTITDPINGPIYYTGDYSFYGGDPSSPNPGPGGITQTQIEDWVWAAWLTVVDQGAQTITITQWLKFGASGVVFPAGTDTLTFAQMRDKADKCNPTSPVDPTSKVPWTNSDKNTWVPTDAKSFYVAFDDAYITRARMQQCSTAPTLAQLTAISQATSPDNSAWGDYPLTWSNGAADTTDHSGNGHDLVPTSPAQPFGQGVPGPY